MYRDSSDSLALTIERLEGELHDIRQLRVRTVGRRVLVAITGLSVVTAIVSLGACFAAKARAESYKNHYETTRAAFVEAVGRLETCSRTLAEGPAVCRQSALQSEAVTSTP
jgi:hypothetical protein